ncbi:MAG: hypothetical protein OXG06_04790 [Gammaproteobacteria bacterium]|nr:hypothetical protein [Gammaproteobacteria bacterium]
MEPLFPLGDWRWGVIAILAFVPMIAYELILRYRAKHTKPKVRRGKVSFHTGAPQISARGTARRITLRDHFKNKLASCLLRQSSDTDQTHEVIVYWDETNSSMVDNLTRSLYGVLRDKKFPKTIRNKTTGEIKEIPHPDGKHWSNRKR